MKKTLNYTPVTRRNLRTIEEKLRQRRGSILIAEPGPHSFPGEIDDISLELFAKPLINSQEKMLYVKRGSKKVRGEDWQTGYENDRSYWLRQKPEEEKSDWAAAHSFF